MALDVRRLSKPVASIVLERDNTLLLSAASIWELAIKHSKGRLELDGGFENFLTEELSENDVTMLSITEKHLVEYERLPPLHGDPFDRMLVAQAMQEQIPVISKDALVSQYPIEVIW